MIWQHRIFTVDVLTVELCDPSRYIFYSEFNHLCMRENGTISMHRRSDSAITIVSSDVDVTLW